MTGSFDPLEFEFIQRLVLTRTDVKQTYKGLSSVLQFDSMISDEFFTGASPWAIKSLRVHALNGNLEVSPTKMIFPGTAGPVWCIHADYLTSNQVEQAFRAIYEHRVNTADSHHMDWLSHAVQPTSLGERTNPRVKGWLVIDPKTGVENKSRQLNKNSILWIAEKEIAKTVLFELTNGDSTQNLIHNPELAPFIDRVEAARSLLPRHKLLRRYF